MTHEEPPPALGRPEAPSGWDEPEDRLEGWKALANHLGRDIRTVQRWERRERLPVHRHAHQKQATVYAYRSEFDAWLRHRNVESGMDESSLDTTAGRRAVHIWSALGAGAALSIVLLVALRTGDTPGNRVITGRDTDDPAAYAAFAEGHALYFARRYQDAVASLESAVSRDSRYGSAWALLAKTHARLAQPAWAGGSSAAIRATQAAQRAVELAPDAADVRLALALAARARGDVETWRQEAQRALERDPLAAEAYALLGDSYSSLVYACDRDMNPELADGYYQKALELKPDLTTAVSNRATNLRRMGRYDECIDLVDRALKSLADETPLLLVRGGCRLMQGDLTGATEDIAPLRDNPKVSPVGSLVLLGMLALKRGDVEPGVRDLEAAANLHHSPQSELFVAEAYAAASDLPHLMDHLKRAFDMDASCPGIVAASPAFRSVRDTQEVRRLLDQYGIH
ncbi:MAG TPA: tetratricopeptide repeat protein [Phycisphaerae bacterium]|nr:tetratricopeptide repeat protein [Phycisphaerae bacterium]